MSYRPLTLFLLSFLLVTPIFAQRSAGGRQRAINRIPRTPVAAEWQAPACSIVSGLPSMRFLSGSVEGKNRDFIRNASVYSIAPSSQPNVLYATYLEELYESRDAGCTWTQRAHLGTNFKSSWLISLARPELIYAHNRETLVRITPAETTTTPLPGTGQMLEVFVDPADVRHLRAINIYGDTYESTDSGATWTALGDSTAQMIYSVAVDPTDFDHLVAALSIYGISVSYDGGRTWTRNGSLMWTNVFYMQFSPADPRVVWASGIPTREGNRDKLYRSIDGGMTFAPVVLQDFFLYRSKLAPHPTNPALLALGSHDKVTLYDDSTGSINVGAKRAFTTFAWAPNGTLYFAAPDEVVFIDP